MAIVLTAEFRGTVRETLTSGVAAASNAVVRLSEYNESVTLNATTTPPATAAAYFLGTLTAGALTINLAALTGANGAVDLTGLRIQFLRIKNLGANAMTFSEGASNGIALSCLPLVVAAGGIAQFYLNDAAPDVAAGDRTIDVSGTGAQTFEISIVAG
jgi:hypothetical protein